MGAEELSFQPTEAHPSVVIAGVLQVAKVSQATPELEVWWTVDTAYWLYDACMQAPSLCEGALVEHRLSAGNLEDQAWAYPLPERWALRDPVAAISKPIEPTETLCGSATGPCQDVPFTLTFTVLDWERYEALGLGDMEVDLLVTMSVACPQFSPCDLYEMGGSFSLTAP